MKKTGLFFLYFAICGLISSSVFPATVSVPEDYRTIQGAIDAVSIDDTIYITSNTYFEHLNVNKSVNLIGDGAASTIVDGGGVGDVIHITADNVLVKNLSAIHGGDNQSQDGEWDAGIKIKQADYCIIEFCGLHDNSSAGFSVIEGQYNIIRYCRIFGNSMGIYFCGRYVEDIPEPFEWDNNIGNEILDNNIYNNIYSGIGFEHGIPTHRSNIIQGNFIHNNSTGIEMVLSYYNAVTYNQIQDNNYHGVFWWICSGGGGECVFNYNCFIDNNGGEIQAIDYYEPISPEGPNNWSSNYWSDCTGECNVYCLDSYMAYCWGVIHEYDDVDDDGIMDQVDNCVNTQNADQLDDDFDYIGNSCDECTDFDNDGFGNPGYASNTCDEDNCPNIYNPDQLDTDGDNIGDACDDVCGDANFDREINILDIVYLINYRYKQGSEPYNLQYSDVDSSCAIDILDIVYLINFLYKNGFAPGCPTVWPCS